MPNVVWSLDLGFSAVKAVKMQRSGNRVDIVDLAVIDIERDEDETTRPMRLQMAMSELVNRKRITTTPVILAIPGNQSFFRPFSLPPVPADRIEEIVKYEARQQIPFPIEEVEWGWQHHETTEGESDFGVDMVAVRKDIIQHHLDICDGLGLRLIGIQSAPLGLYNLICHEFAPEDTILVLDIGAKETDFLIVQGRHWWVRPLPLGGNDITRLLEQKFRYSFDEAEGVKLKMAQSKQAEKIFRVVEPSLRNLASEVQRTLGYYKSLARGVRVTRCYITGKGSRLMNVSAFLHQFLRVPVESIEAPSTMQLGRGAEAVSAEMAGLSVAIGMGLQGLDLGALAPTMELLPEERRRAQQIEAKKPTVAAAVAVLVLAVLLSYFAASNEAHEVAGSINDIQDVISGNKKRNIKGIKDMEQLVEQAEAGIHFEELRTQRWERIGRERGWYADCLGELLRLTDRGLLGENAAPDRLTGKGQGVFVKQFYMSRTPPVVSKKAGEAFFAQIKFDEDNFGAAPYITTLPDSKKGGRGGGKKKAPTSKIPSQLANDAPMYCVMIVEFGPHHAGTEDGDEDAPSWDRIPPDKAAEWLKKIKKELSKVKRFESLSMRLYRLGKLPISKLPRSLRIKPKPKQKRALEIYNKGLKKFERKLRDAGAVATLDRERIIEVNYTFEIEKDGKVVRKTEKRKHVQNVLYWLYNDGTEIVPSAEAQGDGKPAP